MAVTSLKELKALQNKRIEKLNTVESKSNKSYEDPTYWQPQTDEEGNGSAVIRFLPEAVGEDVVFVELYEHAFKGPGGWYINGSRTTLGKTVSDPVTDLTNRLWETKDAVNITLARAMKRKHYYVSNILVVTDAKNPENEGKVFRFKYGKKIHDMIAEARNPIPDEDDPQTPIDAFDPWSGANFKLVCRKVEGQRNYDKSKFLKPGPIGTDEEIDAIWKRQHSLTAIVAADKFDSYENLQARLLKVMGPVVGTGIETVAGAKSAPQAQAPARTERLTASASVQAPVQSPVHVTMDEDDDDNDLALFKKMTSS